MVIFCVVAVVLLQETGEQASPAVRASEVLVGSPMATAVPSAHSWDLFRK